MRLKDKLKTVAITLGFGFLGSCSSKREKLEPIERAETEVAQDDLHKKIFDVVPENGSISYADAQKLAESSSGENASKRIIKAVETDAGIPITKSGKNGKDSILYSVQNVNEGTCEKPHWVLKNPRYALNEKKGNTKKVGNVEVKQQNTETYQLDRESIGVESVKSEIVSTEITKTREIDVGASIAGNLNKGDTIMVGKVPAVVKEDGKNPVVEDKVVQNTKVDTYIFNYTRHTR